MPLSPKFLTQFSAFVKHYKESGAPAIYHLAKERHYSTISTELEGINALCENNKEAFHETSIIDHLNAIILLASPYNKYVLKCWTEFLQQYNNSAEIYTAIGCTDPQKREYTISNGATGIPSELLILNLQTAIEKKQQAFELAEASHKAEKELLERQLTVARAQIEKLSTQNQEQQEQLNALTRFKGLHSHLQKAQEQFTELAGFFGMLTDITTKADGDFIHVPQLKPVETNKDPIERPKQQQTTAQPIAASSTDTNNAVIDTLSQIEVLPPKIPVVIKAPPPPPPAPPIVSTKPFQTKNFFDELALKIKERAEHPVPDPQNGQAKKNT